MHVKVKCFSMFSDVLPSCAAEVSSTAAPVAGSEGSPAHGAVSDKNHFKEPCGFIKNHKTNVPRPKTRPFGQKQNWGPTKMTSFPS